MPNKATRDNNLLAKYPNIAKQWHPTKNGNLTPEDFTSGSGKQVWWKCHERVGFEWEARIYTMTRRKSSRLYQPKPKKGTKS